MEKNSNELLREYVARIERLDEEIKEYQEMKKSVFAEAKAMGFDVKAIRACLKLRKQEPHEIEEQQAIVDTYMAALGHLSGTDLGDFAVRQKQKMDEVLAEA